MPESKNQNDKAELLEEGLRRLHMKQPSAAISAFQAALRSDPASAGAYSGIGEAFLDMEEFLGAKAAFSKSIELAPTAARYVLLGYALDKLGEKRMAFRAFRNALRLSPNDEDALFNMGKTLEARHPKIACALWTNVIEANPSHGASYLELGALLNRSGRFAEEQSRVKSKHLTFAD